MRVSIDKSPSINQSSQNKKQDRKTLCKMSIEEDMKYFTNCINQSKLSQKFKAEFSDAVPYEDSY